jgi:hypothetical protein
VRVLLVVSFFAGLIPAVILWALYWSRTRWEESDAGKAFFALLAVTALSYLSSVLALVWPDFFSDTAAGLWLRIVVRFAIAAVLLNLLRLFFRAQREGRPIAAPPRNGPGEEDG